MSEIQVYYINFLKNELARKQRLNPNYSLRSFAKYLGLHSSTLSQVMTGKRILPLKSAHEIAQKFKLSEKEYKQLVSSIQTAKAKKFVTKNMPQENSEQYLLDQNYATIISEWEHFAVLTLFDLSNVIISKDMISAELGLSKLRTEVVLNNLESTGFIQKDPFGNYKKLHARVITTEDVPMRAIRAAHHEALDLAKKKLEEISVEMREFSSTLLAIDASKIPQAKVLIRNFRESFATLMNDENKNQVYQISIQFFPITKIERDL